MKNNVQKFVELLQADEAFREKVQDAIRNYSGEENAEAVFQKVFRPAAEEKGFGFTLEDMKAYIQEKTDSEQMLSQDELDQAAGGLAVGIGGTVCYLIGIGFGVQAKEPDHPAENGPDHNEVGGCAAIGAGNGAGICMAVGTAHQFF